MTKDKRTSLRLAALAAVVAAAGCGTTLAPMTDAGAPSDAASAPDAVVSPELDGGPVVLMDSGSGLDDSDGDGLCDATEISWGTNPFAADSDLDGLTDRAERDLGYAPLRPDSPERDLLVFLNEGADSSVQLPVQHIVLGNGETFTGGFQALPVPNRLEYDATTFLELAHAVGATPMENVFELRADEQRFVGVFGRTQLTFEIRFRFGSATPRECVTTFPFRYQIKNDDGRTLASESYLLVVLPRGQRLDTANWCAPEGACI